jgi:hypothetical protein
MGIWLCFSKLLSRWSWRGDSKDLVLESSHISRICPMFAPVVRQKSRQKDDTGEFNLTYQGERVCLWWTGDVGGEIFMSVFQSAGGSGLEEPAHFSIPGWEWEWDGPSCFFHEEKHETFQECFNNKIKKWKNKVSQQVDFEGKWNLLGEQ